MSSTSEVMVGRIVAAVERIAGVAHVKVKRRKNNPGKSESELQLERLAVALEKIAGKSPKVEPSPEQLAKADRAAALLAAAERAQAEAEKAAREAEAEAAEEGAEDGDQGDDDGETEPS